jgi:hypothetical protein
MEARGLKVMADSQAATLLLNRSCVRPSCRSFVSGVMGGPAAPIMYAEHISAVCRSRRHSRRDPYGLHRGTRCSGLARPAGICSHPDHVAAT